MWDVAYKGSKVSRGGLHGRRESFDEFPEFTLGFSKKGEALGTSGQKRERHERSEFPFPAISTVEEIVGVDEKDRAEVTDPSSWSGSRSESSETIRPGLSAINTDPGAFEQLKKQQEQEDYPICHSPIHSHFKVPEWKPEPEPLSLDDQYEDQSNKSYNNARIGTDELAMSKPISISIGNVNSSAQLPTPPDSLTSNKSLLSPEMAFAVAGGIKSAPARVSYAPMSPSPGYTVASLPPVKKQEHGDAAEIAEELVAGVMRYLSLEFESVAWKFDAELALYSGIPMELVRKDRKYAVKKYVERWVTENPEIESGDKKKGGLW
jgi:hypothetical protein